jgi:mono/diheme cytochrome c family protein
MDDDRKRLGTSFVLGIAATLGAAVLIGLIVVYTGAYNVAATEGHTAAGRWALDTTMHNSVEARADRFAGTAPEALSIEAGAKEYASMCQHCHAGPGVSRAEWAKGMMPQPPHLTEHASEWEPEEIRWILEHGIKMSGMPAFGPTHEDEVLWDITAFVKTLPGMTPERYQALTAGAGHGHGGGHEGGHEGGESGGAHQHGE